MTDRVRLRATGRFPERFVERALARGVRFETVERLGPRALRLTASTPDARIVAALARELGLELTLESRTGWRAALARASRRLSLLAGLALFAALVALFAARVWVVGVTPLDAALPPAREAALAARLAALGAKPGAPRASLDPALMSARLLSEFEELTFAGVRLRGVRLTLEYKTEDAPPPLENAKAAGHLFAARDAVVLNVEPLAGRACVKPGDVVRAGQLLVSGEERVGAETTRPLQARGEVVGRVWFTSEARSPLTVTTRARTGRSRCASALRLFAWRWPLAEAADFAGQDVETERLPVGGLYLPVVIERTVLHEVTEREETADRGALEQALSREALANARAQLPPEARETAAWTTAAEENGSLSVEAVVEATMNIAVEN